MHFFYHMLNTLPNIGVSRPRDSKTDISALFLERRVRVFRARKKQ